MFPPVADAQFRTRAVATGGFGTAGLPSRRRAVAPACRNVSVDFTANSALYCE